MIKKLLKNKKVWIGIAIVFTILLIWTLWGNKALELNTYKISSDRLPESFEGYRIAHVSDVHNEEFGENNEKLLEIIRSAKPDMIAITGDMIDSSRTDIQVAIDFANEVVKIAPTYYITGNHEQRISEYAKLEAGLRAAGVVVLRNEKIQLESAGEYITLIGVDDPSFETDYLFGDSASVLNKHLGELASEEDSYRILLSHRPELFEVYVENDMNLVLSGHAHGGQVRLPFVGGLAAPNQGLFPKYDSGLYTEDDTNMIVSRGIGNSLIPMRFNNRPEVILIELEKEGK